MYKETNKDVSGTAFVVNYSRSLREDISRDVYARLWVTPESIALYDELCKWVYQNDDLNISLRNRFYFEQINRFCSRNKNTVYVGVAAGLSNYPFLADGVSHSVEVDLPGIISYKKKKLAGWIRKGMLPQRSLGFIEADLMSETERVKMCEFLRPVIGKRPSVITMEGLTYYLDEKSLNELFSLFSGIQTKNSLLIFDYWKPNSMEYPVMQKLRSFMNERFGNPGTKWFFIDKPFIMKVKGYTQVMSSDIANLEREYAGSRIFQGRDNKIPVYFSVLRKNR